METSSHSIVSRQTKILLAIGGVCLASALVWQNYSWVAFRLSHHLEASKAVGEWYPGQLYVHHSAPSNILLLVGALGLLFTFLSLVGDMKQLRQHRRVEHGQ
jgi:hypothetical protein